MIDLTTCLEHLRSSGVDEITMNGDLRRFGSRQGSPKVTIRQISSIEEKWSEEVKLDGYGILVVFNDTSELISSQSGPRNF